jgi:hypothetical protein
MAPGNKDRAASPTLSIASTANITTVGTTTMSAKATALEVSKPEPFYKSR